MSGEQRIGLTRDHIVESDNFQALVNTDAATWSVVHRPTGVRLAHVYPEISVRGLAVDLSAYKVAAVAHREVTNELGSFQAVTMTYRTSGGLGIIYSLFISDNDDEILVELALENETGGELVVQQTRPVVVDSLSLGGRSVDWRVIGDQRTTGDHYTSGDVVAMGRTEYWWYCALQRMDVGCALLAGNLTNHKGLGRFVVEPVDERSVAMTAWCDYEDVVLPGDMTMPSEKTLLAFGARGLDCLDRFATLVARTHRIELLKEAPLAADDPSLCIAFNGWDAYGAAAVATVQCSHDSYFEQPHLDPVWREKNERAWHALGLADYVHPGWSTARTVAEAMPLARRGGRPDRAFPEARQTFDQRPEFYVDSRIDFSNAAAVAFEAERARRFFAEHGEDLVIVSGDWLAHWRQPAGCSNPALTSVESLRAGLQPWRTLGRKHPGGRYVVARAVDIGMAYDVCDVVNIGQVADRRSRGDQSAAVVDLARQAAGRFFYNGKVWWSGMDCLYVFLQGLYSVDDARVHATLCAIAGNAIWVGEPLADETLPEDRLEIIRRALPGTPDVAVAVDLFEHDPARLWSLPIKRSFGEWTVAALFNFKEPGVDKPIVQEIRFADLDLSATADYLVYEFWNRRFLGVKRGGFSRALNAPDCEVYAIVERREHPVLMSTNRHVRQMAVDVLSIEWREEAQCLVGRSAVVGADPYQLRIHVPERYAFRKATAADLDVVATVETALLTVTVTPRSSGSLEWQVFFAVAR